MIKGIIFDLDGVLVSTDELHFQAWKRLAQDLAIPDFSREDNERQRGISRMASLEIVLEKTDKIYTQEEKIKLADRKNEYYKELLNKLDDAAVLHGVIKTLKELKQKNLLLAVGSASKNAPAILERTGIMPYLNQLSCGLDTTHSKPDPEIFQIAALRLQLAPKECLVVEDSVAGVEAAKRGGMRSLGVGPLHLALNADFSAQNLESIENWNEILA